MPMDNNFAAPANDFEQSLFKRQACAAMTASSQRASNSCEKRAKPPIKIPVDFKSVMKKNPYILDELRDKEERKDAGDYGLRYGQIRKYDTANGPGIRSTLFVTGCTRNCPHCFNQDYMDFCFGKIWTDAETEQLMEWIKRPEIAGITILGGEPFENCSGLIKIMKKLRPVIDEKKKNAWVYSGYTFDEIIEDPLKLSLLQFFEVLVDGPYIHSLRNLRICYRGSSNQRIIDIPASLAMPRGECKVLGDELFLNKVF